MFDFSSFHFFRPWWFIAIVPLCALLWWLAKNKQSTSRWEQVCDTKLLPFILAGQSLATKKYALCWIACAALLAIAALAGPVWERLPQPIFRDQSALVIAMDLSRSMDAIDIQPSRLQRAKYKISDFIHYHQSGETAILAYSNDAFVAVPLTNDTNAIELFLQSLHTGLMSKQGSRPENAIQVAGEILQRRGLNQGNVILVTDYANQDAVSAAGNLRAKGYRLSVLGVGTEHGGPIYLPSGNLLKKNNEVVVPKLQEKLLRQVATAGEGVYQQLNTAHDNDIETLGLWLEALSLQQAELQSEQQGISDQWHERGPWLLLLLLPIAAVAFKRGFLVLAVIIITAQPQLSYAFEWQDLWSRPNQQAAELFEADALEQAAELFTDDKWKAVAEYKNENFEKAQELLKDKKDKESFYNRGNALAQAGEYQKAINAYKNALEIEPNMEDALHNMGVAKKVMQQMQQQAQQQAGDNKENEDGDKKEQQAEGQSGEQDDKQEGGDKQDEGDKQEEGDKQDEGENNTQEKDKENEKTDEDKNGESDKESEEGGEHSENDRSNSLMGEEKQALEQALRSVQDDPGALLKRKFMKMEQDNRQQGKSDTGEQDPW